MRSRRAPHRRTIVATKRGGGKLFVAASVVGALNTVNGWRPLDRKGRLSSASWPGGAVTSEFPLQSLALQGAVTAGWTATGRLRPRTAGAARAGLVVSAASWVGLAG